MVCGNQRRHHQSGCRRHRKLLHHPPLTSTASYWVRAVNTGGSADSNTVTATVNTPPTIITQTEFLFAIKKKHRHHSDGRRCWSLSLTYQWYNGNFARYRP